MQTTLNTIGQIRKSILEMVYKAQVSHVGAALSVVDILYTLYFKCANISKDNIDDPNRDRIILSKGHASAALYAVLAQKEMLSKEMLEGYSKNGGTLPCHIDKETSKAFECSSGSLGHGPSIGVGMALAAKIDKLSSNIYVIAGDGECNEGSVWEAIMYASSKKLDNFTLIIDFNGIQAFGNTRDVVNQTNLAQRLTAFGFDTIEVDGHNVQALEHAIKKHFDGPKAIVAHTVKGKGVSFMENSIAWHYKSPNDEQYKAAIKEIEEKYQ